MKHVVEHSICKRELITVQLEEEQLTKLLKLPKDMKLENIDTAHPPFIVIEFEAIREYKELKNEREDLDY